MRTCFVAFEHDWRVLCQYAGSRRGVWAALGGGQNLAVGSVSRHPGASGAVPKEARFSWQARGAFVGFFGVN